MKLPLLSIKISQMLTMQIKVLNTTKDITIKSSKGRAGGYGLGVKYLFGVFKDLGLIHSTTQKAKPRRLYPSMPDGQGAGEMARQLGATVLAKDRFRFPAPTCRLTAVHRSSPRGSGALF